MARQVRPAEGRGGEAASALVARLGGGLVALEASRVLGCRRAEWDDEERRPGLDTGLVKVGPVAVIRLRGVIVPRGSALMDGWGLAPLNLFRARLDRALADDGVRAIVLDIDSPGGMVTGTPEAAAHVARAAAIKPVTAVAAPLAASAAYWIASQAGELVVAPSGEVGSIGVVAMHADYSRALDEEGVTVTVIRSARNKFEGSPWEPLSEATRAHWQSDVDRTHRDFVAAVARGRRRAESTVTGAEWGEGRMLEGVLAVAAGMADRTGELAETVATQYARAGATRQATQPRVRGAVTIDDELLAARIALA